MLEMVSIAILLLQIIVLCNIALIAYCQVDSEVRSQPWPIKINQVGDCCTFIDDIDQLAKCLNKTSIAESVSSSTKPRKVAIVSYASPDGGPFGIPDIDKFALYHKGIMSAYAEHNGYTYRMFTRQMGSNYEPRDSRWNKVMILINALDDATGWARSMDWIVWLDVDAIVLDLGMKIELVGKQFPLADIIASADIRMGYINSGFMLFRNTKWTREFLLKWWNIVDRSKTCDQDAFDLLYAELLQASSSAKLSGSQSKTAAGQIEKIKVLRMDALNSEPPAMLHQRPHNQVLHLMGEVTMMRHLVFKSAFAQICRARSGGVLAHQLGVHKQAILSIASEVYTNETFEYIRFVNSSASSTLDMFEMLSKSAHHLSDIYSNVDSNDNGLMALQLREDIYSIVKLRVEALNKSVIELKDKIGESIKSQKDGQTIIDPAKVEAFNFNSELLQNNTFFFIMMMKKLAEAGNDYYGVLNDVDMKCSIAREVFATLDELHDRVAKESQHVPLHMKALMHQNLGVLYYELLTHSSSGGYQRYQVSNMKNSSETFIKEEAKSNLIQSVKLFEKVIRYNSGDSSTRREYIHSVQILAALYCMIKDYSSGLPQWASVIALADSNTNNIAIGLPYATLSEVLHNAAVCYYHGGVDLIHIAHLKRAKELLTRSMEIRLEIQQSNEIQTSASSKAVVDQVFELSRNLLETVDSELTKLDTKAAPSMPTSSRVPLDSSSNSDIKIAKQSMFADEDEWEECTEGEEGCEAFFIEEDEGSGETMTLPDKSNKLVSEEASQPLNSEKIKLANAKSPSNIASKAKIDADEDVEDDDYDDYELELEEVKALYARQSAAYRPRIFELAGASTSKGEIDALEAASSVEVHSGSESSIANKLSSGGDVDIQQILDRLAAIEERLSRLERKVTK